MGETKIIFEEKQYLGFNRFSIIRRMVICFFCFLAYYWSQNPKPVDVSGIQIMPYPIHNIPNSGELFFLLGIILLIVSGLLVFVKHLHTIVTENSITLIGLWTQRKLTIDLSTISSITKVRYPNLILKQPVFKLHRNGTIRFYTFGNEAIELTAKNGIKYRIGSQRVNELYHVLNEKIIS